MASNYTRIQGEGVEQFVERVLTQGAKEHGFGRGVVESMMAYLAYLPNTVDCAETFTVTEYGFDTEFKVPYVMFSANGNKDQWEMPIAH